MLIESLGVKPHQARLLHVLEQDGSIFIPVLAKQVIAVAFPFVATKIKAETVLEGTLLGKGLRGGGALL